MTQSERSEIAGEWVFLAEMYGKTISPQVAVRLVEAVSDLPFRAVLSALKEWPRVSKFDRHPNPYEVRNMASPMASDDALAKEAAARVVQAVGRFGWNNVAQAKEFIGELGWGIVARIGGWQYLCENLGLEMSQTTVMAQMRDLAKAQMELARAGRLGEAPGLPEPVTNVMDQISQKAGVTFSFRTLDTCPEPA